MIFFLVRMHWISNLMSFERVECQGLIVFWMLSRWGIPCFLCSKKFYSFFWFGNPKIGCLMKTTPNITYGRHRGGVSPTNLPLSAWTQSHSVQEDSVLVNSSHPCIKWTAIHRNDHHVKLHFPLQGKCLAGCGFPSNISCLLGLGPCWPWRLHLERDCPCNRRAVIVHYVAIHYYRVKAIVSASSQVP